MASAVTVARVEELPEGTGRAFNINGREIAVFNCGGQLYAIDKICSHAYAELQEGYVDSEECTVECPLHGSQFDLRTGRPKTLPATLAVETYEVVVEGGEVRITLP